MSEPKDEHPDTRRGVSNVKETTRPCPICDLPMKANSCLARLAARVEELEDRVRECRDGDAARRKIYREHRDELVDEIARLREALVGIGAAAMRWKMRAGEISDKVRSREAIQHVLNLVDVALKEKP